MPRGSSPKRERQYEHIKEGQRGEATRNQGPVVDEQGAARAGSRTLTPANGRLKPAA